MSANNDYIRIAEEFIRRGESDYASQMLAKYNGQESFLWNVLKKFAVAEIGIGNIPLLTTLFSTPNIKLEYVISALSSSNKLPIVFYMEVYFRRFYIEPLPPISNSLSDMRGLFNMQWLRIASSMYWSGMDNQFWDIIANDMPSNLSQLCGYFKKTGQNADLSKYSWILGVVLKYYVQNDLPLLSNYNKLERKASHLIYKPMQTRYYKHLEESPFDLNEWKSIYRSAGKNQPRRRNIPLSSDYFYIDGIVKFGHNKTCDNLKSINKLSDLGTMRLLKVKKRGAMTLLFQCKGRSYELREWSGNYEKYERCNEYIRHILGDSCAPKTQFLNIAGKIKAQRAGFIYLDIPQDYILYRRYDTYGTIADTFYANEGNALDFDFAMMKCLKYILGLSQSRYHINVINKDGMIGIHSAIHVEKNNIYIPCKEFYRYRTFMLNMAEKVIKKAKNKFGHEDILKRAKVIKYRVVYMSRKTVAV